MTRYQSATIAEELRQRIVSGHWRSRQRIPSEHALTREFSVSRGTVIRSLQRLEREGLLRTRHGDGRFVADPNERPKTMTIGLVMPDINMLSHPVTAEQIAGVREACIESGYHLEIFGFNGRLNAQGLDQVLARLDAKRLDGVLLATELITGDRVADVCRQIPIVSMSGTLDLRRGVSVLGDMLGVVQDVGEHLVGLGHRRIAVVTSRRHRVQRTHQTEGIRLALRRATGECNPVEAPRSAPSWLRVHAAASNLATDWLDEFREAMSAPASERATAVFFGSDDLALNGFKVLNELGMKIPQDLSVVSCNDTLHPPTVPVPLTTIRFSWQDLTRRATQLLVEMMSDPNLTLLDPMLLPMRFVARESTAPPAGVHV